MTATKKKITLEMLEDEIARMDPAVKRGSDEFKTAIVVLACAFVDPRTVPQFTGYSANFVRERLLRLERSGVIDYEGNVHADWFRKKGGISFWLDVNVAMGYMNRVPATKAS